MEDLRYRELIDEVMRQVKARYAMAQERLCEYDGEDPVKSLVLTERQRGTMEGRIETWKFMQKLIPDVVTLVEEKYLNENREKTD